MAKMPACTLIVWKHIKKYHPPANLYLRLKAIQNIKNYTWCIRAVCLLNSTSNPLQKEITCQTSCSQCSCNTLHSLSLCAMILR